MMSRGLSASTGNPVLTANEEKRRCSDEKMFGNAQAYERFMGRWSRQIAPLLVDFVDAPDSGRVLDIGSGTGSLAFELAKRKTGIHVIGIDPSPEYVGYAASKNPFPDRVSFHTGDAQHLDFENAAFAASISLLVFNFIPDAAKALNEARRATQPKGRVAAAVWDYGGRMRMLRAFWDAAAEIQPGADKVDERNMPLSRSGELSQLWTLGGLEQVREQPLETEIRFSSFSDFWEPFLLGQGPAGAFVRTLDDDRLQHMRTAVRRRLARSSEDEAFTLPARVWAVRGVVPPA
jgi:SAM-dependent methyltransferase